jgi:hypothetical protein
VRVGRAPLDEDAIRLIEQSNPGLEFDWTRILKSQEPGPEQRPAVQHERRARPRTREFPPRDAVPPTPVPAPPVLHRSADPEPEHMRGPERTDAAVVLPFPQPIESIDGEVTRHQASAAAVRLGPEGLSRLRARHAEILARVDEKISDPVRREQLKADAERLNPDTWVTDAEVTTGLESYETVFETLRSVIGRRRKRRRRRTGGESDSAGESDAGGESDSGSAAHGEDVDQGPATGSGSGGSDESNDPDDESGDR